MTFDQPDNLDTYADRIAANGGDLEAGVLRAFANAWHADCAAIAELQAENTQLQRDLDAARSQLAGLRSHSIAAARSVFDSAKVLFDKAAA